MEGLRLAGQLREEEGVAPGQAHRRAAPGGVGRDVAQQAALGIELCHVEVQAGGAGVVAAEALVGGDVLAVIVRHARPHPDILVGLRGQGRHLVPGRPALEVGEREGGEEIRIVAVVRLAQAQPVAIRQHHLAVVRQDRRHAGLILREEDQGHALLAQQVARRGEGEIVARRAVAVHAVLPEAHVGQPVLLRRGRPVGVPAAPAEPAPEPAIVRGGGIPDHDRSAAGRQQLQRIDFGAARGRRRIHLLDQHRPVRHRRAIEAVALVVGPAVLAHPGRRLGRVPDDHRRMGSVIGAAPALGGQDGGEGPGIAHRLVPYPAARLVAMAERPQVVAELGLVLAQRQRSRMAHAVGQ